MDESTKFTRVLLALDYRIANLEQENKDLKTQVAGLIHSIEQAREIQGRAVSRLRLQLKESVEQLNRVARAIQ